MSGIFGIFHRHGDAVAFEHLEKMRSVFASWFDDGSEIWSDGNVGLGHVLLKNSSDSGANKGLVVEGPPGQRLVLCADVRLDNRNELRSRLGKAQANDGELLLAAWREWGESSPAHLLGDFSYCVWDEYLQRVFCSRDAMGIKPFYYHLTDDLLVFSNDVRPITALECVPDGLDRERICFFLYDESHASRTFCESVRKLPVATALLVDNKFDRQSTYWHADEILPVTGATLGDQICFLDELLDEVIGGSIDSDFPIACHLSGGLDSASIAVRAGRLLKGNGFRTFNWASRDSRGEHENRREWLLAAELAENEGFDHHNVDLSQETVNQAYRTADLRHNDTQYGWYENAVMESAISMGARTVISGWGGDEFISNNGNAYYSDIFWSGDSLRALNELRHELRASKAKPLSYMIAIYRRVLLPALSDKIYGGFSGDSLFSWDCLRFANPEFKNYGSSVRSQIDNFVPRSAVQGRQLGLLRHGHLAERLESWAAHAMSKGLEYRYPLLDRRIVEFALSLPPNRFYSEGKSRFLFRKANCNVLPASLLESPKIPEHGRVARLDNLMLGSQQLWAKEGPVSGGELIDVGRLKKRVVSDCNQWESYSEDIQLQSLLINYRSIAVANLQAL